MLVIRNDHPLVDEKLTLEKIASNPIVTYMTGYVDRNLIVQTFKEAGLGLDISCSAGDTEVIKTYVRLNLGVGIMAQMARTEEADDDLVFRDVGHLFKDSTTRVVYSEDCKIRKYMEYFIKLLYEYGQTFGKQLV